MLDPLTEASPSARSDRVLRLAEGAIVAGTSLGFALSYSALRRLAAAHGYDAWEAATWPLAVDFVAVSTTALAMALARRRGGPTGETWAVAGAAALVSLSGNVVSAWGDPIAMAMHAWAAAVYIALWHCYWRASSTAPQPERHGASGAARQEPTALGRPIDTTPPWPTLETQGDRPATLSVQGWELHDTAATVARPSAEHGAARPAPRRRRSAISDPRARVRALVQAADQRGERLTGADVARAIGRSPQRGRALLAEVRAELPAGNGNGVHG